MAQSEKEAEVEAQLRDCVEQVHVVHKRNSYIFLNSVLSFAFDFTVS